MFHLIESEIMEIIDPLFYEAVRGVWSRRYSIYSFILSCDKNKINKKCLQCCLIFMHSRNANNILKKKLYVQTVYFLYNLYMWCNCDAVWIKSRLV